MKIMDILAWVIVWLIIGIVVGSNIEQNNRNEIFSKRENKCYLLWWIYYEVNDSCWLIKQKEIRERINDF